MPKRKGPAPVALVEINEEEAGPYWWPLVTIAEGLVPLGRGWVWPDKTKIGLPYNRVEDAISAGDSYHDPEMPQTEYREAIRRLRSLVFLARASELASGKRKKRRGATGADQIILDTHENLTFVLADKAGYIRIDDEDEVHGRVAGAMMLNESIPPHERASAHSVFSLGLDWFDIWVGVDSIDEAAAIYFAELSRYNDRIAKSREDERRAYLNWVKYGKAGPDPGPMYGFDSELERVAPASKPRNRRD